MIISWVSGGLGNQMFQYALGRILANINSDKLYLDLSSYNAFLNSSDTIRNFELDIFKLKYLEASKSKIIRLSDSNPFINMINRVFRTHFNSFPSGYISEKSHRFQPRILELSGNMYLKGFWQSEKYFEDKSSLLRSEFKFIKPAVGKNKKLLNEIENSESVSLHIRRGDYVTVKSTNIFHGTCNLDYYSRAVKYVNKILNDPTYYVFSDDPEWCKKNLVIANKTVFITHNQGSSSWEDMRLMSVCKHNIIANSSFSWWGAWLNTNVNKIVISPKTWFRDQSVDSRDVIPSTWIKL